MSLHITPLNTTCPNTGQGQRPCKPLLKEKVRGTAQPATREGAITTKRKLGAQLLWRTSSNIIPPDRPETQGPTPPLRAGMGTELDPCPQGPAQTVDPPVLGCTLWSATPGSRPPFSHNASPLLTPCSLTAQASRAPGPHTRATAAKATPGCPFPASQLLPDSVGEFMPALGLQEAGVGGWDRRGWSCDDVKRDRR